MSGTIDDMDSGRSKMLTVQKLIDYLKTQNPNACIMCFELSSNAYIEQLPDLPNHLICTVKEDKERELKYLGQWFRCSKDADKNIKREMDEIYRYSKDDDIIIRT